MKKSPFEATDLLASKFLVHGGDGKEGGAEGDPPEGNSTTTTVTTDGEGGKQTTETKETKTPDLQAQLDTERAARIALQKERDDAAESAKQEALQQQDANKQVESERDDYKQKYEKLKGLMETSYLETAILKQYKEPDAEGKNGKGFNFHDPADVRTFLNQSVIRLNMDTGEVEGLDLELKRIAKEKPYLLKPTGENKNEGGGGFTPPPGNTGNHPRGTSQHQRETDRNKLAEKYKIPGFAVK